MMWAPRRLKEVVEVNPRDRELRDMPDDLEVSFVAMAAVSEKTGAIDGATTRRLADVRRGYTSFRENDVLFAKITPCMENGKAALAAGLANGIGFGSTEFHVLRPRCNTNPRFVLHFVRQRVFRDAAKVRMRGAAGQQRVPEDFVKEAPIPAVAPSEQRVIVDLLDQADVLRHKRAQADAKADRVLAALYHYLFVARAPSWPAEPLGQHLRRTQGALQSGPFGSQLHNSDFISHGPVRVVGIDNVLDGEFAVGRNRRISLEKYAELRKFTLEAGDVLVTVMGTIGRSCVVPVLKEPAICTKHVYRIQVDSLLVPDYVSASIRFSPAVRAQLGASTTGQIVAGINSQSIRRLRLTIPPLGVQHQFARAAGQLAALQMKRRASLHALDELFATLTRCAFDGRLTASWRKGRLSDLLAEMELQERQLARLSEEVPS